MRLFLSNENAYLPVVGSSTNTGTFSLIDGDFAKIAHSGHLLPWLFLILSNILS